MYLNRKATQGAQVFLLSVSSLSQVWQLKTMKIQKFNDPMHRV